MAEALPVTVLTGFLGAGKTTLLRNLLARPEMAGAAVLINELGEIGLDHHLVREVRGDVMVLGSGCVCCTVSGDLVRALGELLGGVEKGELPRFDRVLIETTGMADPAGVLATLVSHPALVRMFRPATVVTVVDGVLGLSTLDGHREAVKQAALADRLVISKADVAEPAALEALERRLHGLNRAATVVRASGGEVEPEVLLAAAAGSEQGDADLPRWIAESVHVHVHDHDHDHDHDHGYTGLFASHGGVVTMSVAFARPVRIGPLGLWLALMTQMHGERLLRVKGIVNVEGDDQPMVVHCVQHIVYPPHALAAWPDDDHRTRLVFIGRGLAPHTMASLRASLADTLGQPAI